MDNLNSVNLEQIRTLKSKKYMKQFTENDDFFYFYVFIIIFFFLTLVS